MSAVAKLLAEAKAKGLTATVGPAMKLPTGGLRPPAAGKPKRTPPDVRTGGRGGWAVELRLACRVISTANRRDHWTVLRRRTQMQCQALHDCLAASPLGRFGLGQVRTPAVVTLTHLGPAMDEGDNLNTSFKALRDQIANLLGVNDADPAVRWEYAQRPAGKAGRGVVVRIEGR